MPLQIVSETAETAGMKMHQPMRIWEHDPRVQQAFMRVTRARLLRLLLRRIQNAPGGNA